MQFLKSDYCKNPKKVIFWSDNCTHQNKNYLLYSNLLLIVNDTSILVDKIIFKYLEVGHTENSCNSLHGNISQNFKRNTYIYSPNHCYSLMKNSRENVTLIPLTYKDIILFENQSKTTVSKSLQITNVKQFKVKKDCNQFF